MTDDDNSTCAPVNQATPDGAVLQYTYSIVNKCIDDGIFKLKVTMDSLVPCWYLRYIFVTGIIAETCGKKGSKVLHPCTILDSQIEHNRNVCTLSCKCDTSLDQCFLQIYSGMKPGVPQFNVCHVY